MKRRIVCLAVCMLAVLLPLRALAAGDTGAGVRTDAGDWKPSRSAMPGDNRSISSLAPKKQVAAAEREKWKIRLFSLP